MSFTIATAISRLSTGSVNYFKAGATSAQQLQRVNECLERLWNFGMWDGLLQEISLTSTGGIITLPAQYRKLVALRINDSNCGNKNVSIKSQQWKFSPSAPRERNWFKGNWADVAFDLGDVGVAYIGGQIQDGITGSYYNVAVENGVLGIVPSSGATQTLVASGARQYQVSGNPDYVDTLTFTGMARLRYIWAVDTTVTVWPDNYQALLYAVQSFYWRDMGDDNRADALFSNALNTLEKDLDGILSEEDLGSITLEPTMGMGGIPNIL